MFSSSPDEASTTSRRQDARRMGGCYIHRAESYIQRRCGCYNRWPLSCDRHGAVLQPHNGKLQPARAVLQAVPSKLQVTQRQASTWWVTMSAMETMPAGCCNHGVAQICFLLEHSTANLRQWRAGGGDDVLRWGAGVAETGFGCKMHQAFMEPHPAKWVALDNDCEIGMGPVDGDVAGEVDLFSSREMC
ncbi:hypothetical protein VPH35_016248 [Triticum aestivum]